MKECYRCGATEDQKQIFEAVHTTGIVNVCRDCFSKFKMPIVQKKHVDWGEVEKRESVRDKLSRISSAETGSKSVVSNSSHERTLRDIIEDNLNKTQIKRENFPDTLIPNFHWEIMMKRRALRLTRVQFGEKLGIPEVIVEALERGVLPQDYEALFKRMEAVYGIVLFKREEKPVEVKKEEITSVSDVEEKKIPWTKKIFSWMKKDRIEAEDLDLELVNEIVGEPIDNTYVLEIKSAEEKPAEKVVEKKISLSDNRIVPKVNQEELFFEQRAYRDEPNFRKSFEEKIGENKKPVEPQKRELTEDEIRDLIWRN